MRLRVDLLPTPPYRGAVILVDVLRASTVASLLFSNGLARLTITPSVKLARKLGNNELLLGERDGFPPEGFNHGCSPAELSYVDVQGKSAIMVANDASKAMEATRGASDLLLGSLYNATAVCEVAVEAGWDSITVVCCGFRGGEDLDDALTAGFLATRLKSMAPEVTLKGAGRFSVSLLRAFPDPLEGLWQSVAGHFLRRHNQDKDLAFASLIDQCDEVPILESGQPDERLYRFRSRRP